MAICEGRSVKPQIKGVELILNDGSMALASKLERWLIKLKTLADFEEAIMKMQYIACIERFNRTLRPLNATQNG